MFGGLAGNEVTCPRCCTANDLAVYRGLEIGRSLERWRKRILETDLTEIRQLLESIPSEWRPPGLVDRTINSLEFRRQRIGTLLHEVEMILSHHQTWDSVRFVTSQGFEQHYTEFCIRLDVANDLWKQLPEPPSKGLVLNPRNRSKIEIIEFQEMVKAGLAKEPLPRLGEPTEIAQMRKSGMSFAAIARELGISNGIVQRRFKESGMVDPISRRLPLDVDEILRLSSPWYK